MEISKLKDEKRPLWTVQGTETDGLGKTEQHPVLELVHAVDFVLC